MGKKKTTIIKLIIFLLFIILIILISNLEYNRKPYIKDYIFNEKYNEDKSLKVTLKIKSFNSNPVYCKFESKDDKSDYIEVKNNKCSYNVRTNKYKITLKYNKNLEAVYKKNINIDKVISIKINKKKKYLALGDWYNIDAIIDYVGDVDTKITYKSSNPDIINVDENGVIGASKEGTSVITARSSNDLEDKFTITSTSLIRKKVLDNNKETVPCNAYSKEQIDMLDDILSSRVEEAGPGTRAGVAAAARFLTLEFPYKVPYFYENGRLTENDNHYIVDGEGRFYHKGLYLGEEKQNQMSSVLSGPSSWGCPLINYEDDGYRKPGEYYPNGFDCSGYVSWILLNGGLDPGDIGAGITANHFDMTDLGELRYINYELMHSGLVHTGDLIGWDGHIAVIAGLTDTSIYVTESLLPGVVLDEYDISSPYSRFYSRYSYIIDLSSVYSGDGNMPDMF